MVWNFSDNRPIYAQIIEHIKRETVSGGLAPGDRLPSVRELAAEAGVNPNTMQRAFAELERTGLVYSQRTSGRFITENTDLIAAMKAELANEKISEFLKSMEQLGYSRDDAAEMIKNYREAETE